MNITSYPKSGWHRLDSKKVTLFLHTDSIPIKDNPSHRHSDLLSFVFYFNSKPIFIDVGRLNYDSNDLLGSYSYTAKAHNSMTIDQFDPQAGINNRKIPDFYRSSNVLTNYKLDSDKFEFIIQHNGFNRIFNSKIHHQRKFKLFNDSFIIEDRLLGKKSHIIDTYFHFDPNIILSKNEENSYTIKNRKENIFFNFSDNNNGLTKSNSIIVNSSSSGLGWNFPNYNIKEKTNSLVYSQKEQLPITNIYTLKWNN